LNDLRLCVISSLNFRLAKRLQSFLASIIVFIADFCQENNFQLNEKPINAHAAGIGVLPSNSNSSTRSTTTEQVQEMVKALRYDFIPYLVKCFVRLFPQHGKCLMYLQEQYFHELMEEFGLLAAEQPVNSSEVPSLSEATAKLAHGEERIVFSTTAHPDNKTEEKTLVRKIDSSTNSNADQDKIPAHSSRIM
jgi:hypothetical protein